VAGPNLHHLQEPKEDKKVQHTSPYKNASPKTLASANQDKVARSNANWSNEMNQHFGGLPFSSLSPSPGLFSSDLSSFELGIFNPQEGGGSRDYFMKESGGSRDYFTSPSATPQNKSSKQLACQLGNQRSADWGIIDGSFLPPLPTLTPPTEDPYSFMTHSSAGFYPCASAAASQRAQNVYSSNPVNTPISGFPSGSSMMKGHHQPFNQMAAGVQGLKGSGATGSLVNFNLSTIFPEINVPSATGPNCQTKPLVGIPTIHPSEFIHGSRSSQLAASDTIPHSIALLGHTSHQVPAFSVASGLSSNMVPGLPPFPSNLE